MQAEVQIEYACTTLGTSTHIDRIILTTVAVTVVTDISLFSGFTVDLPASQLPIASLVVDVL